ncbi:RNA-binding S4 domain-containing protein [Gemmatimonadota bacterium]
MEGVRLDRWLWAARFYKTRALAVRGIDGGKVHLNGSRTKRSKNVRPGDKITIRKGVYEYDIEIRAISDRRGSASVAQELYEENSASIERRQQVKAQIKAAPTPGFDGRGRPTKKDRRMLDRMKDEIGH